MPPALRCASLAASAAFLPASACARFAASVALFCCAVAAPIARSCSFIAFSTANPRTAMANDSTQLTMLSNARISTLFTATVQATEEAIVNALLAAQTMEGVSGTRVYGLPAPRAMDALRKYGRFR